MIGSPNQEGSEVMPHLLPDLPPGHSATHPTGFATDPVQGSEADIRRRLLAEEGLIFSSLVVRRVADGICLEGVLEIEADDIDVNAAAVRIIGKTALRNHLVVRNADSRDCSPAVAKVAPRLPR